MDWFYLPYKPVKGDYLKIQAVMTPSGICRLTPLPDLEEYSVYWSMENLKQSVLELLSQVERAQGNVFISGLGLGIATLLIANKESVNQVVVSEIDLEVIHFFKGQGFDTSKITIVNESWEQHKGSIAYDWVMLDHYDFAPDTQKLKSEYEYFKSNNSGGMNLDFYLWWSFEQSLMDTTPEMKQRYSVDVWGEDFDCGFIIDALKQIHARRTRNA